MSGRLESFSLPNLSLFIVKVLTGEYRQHHKIIITKIWQTAIS
jgi:hypothetical protein